MKPELKDIQVIILTDKQENELLSSWLVRFPHVRRFKDIRVGNPGPFFVQVAQNQSVRWFLDTTDLPWLLLVDDDMVPVSGTGALVESEADVASATYPGQAGGFAHGQAVGSLGTGILKASRYALEKMGPPWFGVKLSKDGCSLTECVCDWFARRAKEAGFYPVKAGICGHIVSYVALPTEDGGMKVMPLAAIPEALGRGSRRPEEKPAGKGDKGERQRHHHDGDQAVQDGPKDDITIGGQGKGPRGVGEEPTPQKGGPCGNHEGDKNGGQQTSSHGKPPYLTDEVYA